MSDFLPESFKERMRELLGDEYQNFINSYDKGHLCGLRANLLKLSPQRLKEILPFALRQIPWIKNGFYYDEKEQPAKHPYYYAGLYYIQEPSAMTPANLLPVRPGDRVLDLCAAPGGKSTELAARLQGRGLLVSNDISNSRAKALLKNIELAGVRNAIVVSEPPSKLTDYFEGYFDCVLVDAPCSGEGMFRKSRAIIKNWEQYGTEYYAKLQREILPSAVKMLRPGGYLVYSTCTFSPQENEGTMKFVLESFPDMHVIPAVSSADYTHDASAVNPYIGFAPAAPELVSAPEEVSNALRLYPHRVEGEGHFVALLRKDMAAMGDLQAAAPCRCEIHENIYERAKCRSISDEAFDFLERVKFEIPAERIEVRDDRLFLMPEEHMQLKGLRVLRSGLLLGEMKKSRFEPSQALACALKADEYDNVYSMAPDSDEVVRYLKCESIQLPGSVKDGYVLMCVDGFPLGWGKCTKGSFKNKYLPGWRMM